MIHSKNKRFCLFLEKFEMIHFCELLINLDGSLLDIADCGRFPSLFHSLLEHTSSITGLLSISGSSSPVLVSSSLDGTCKVTKLNIVVLTASDVSLITNTFY